MTTLIPTRGMGFASEVEDRVIVVDDGTITESGLAEEIFTDLRQERAKTFLARVPKRI